MLWRINQAPALTMRFATASCVTAGKKEKAGSQRGICHGEASGTQRRGEDGLQPRKTAAQEGREVPKASNAPGKERRKQGTQCGTGTSETISSHVKFPRPAEVNCGLVAPEDPLARTNQILRQTYIRNDFCHFLFTKSLAHAAQHLFHVSAVTSRAPALLTKEKN